MNKFQLYEALVNTKTDLHALVSQVPESDYKETRAYLVQMLEKDYSDNPPGTGPVSEQHKPQVPSEVKQRLGIVCDYMKHFDFYREEELDKTIAYFQRTATQDEQAKSGSLT